MTNPPPVLWALLVAGFVLALLQMAGCGSVTPAVEDAGTDAGVRVDAVPEVTVSADAAESRGNAGAGGAGGAGGDGDAGVDYGPAPGPRPGVPDGGWVGGIVGNCYDVKCGDGSSRNSMCNAAGTTGGNTCVACPDTPLPAPPCVTNGTGRKARDYYVHDCTDPLCQ